jgi:hypothetical protein
VRGDLVTKGFEQIKKFSWDKAAEETYTIFSHIKLSSKC